MICNLPIIIREMKAGLRNHLYSLATDKKTGVVAAAGKLFLFLLSLLYSLALRVPLFFYRSRIFKAHQLPARVISVGNITLGGTGKTPLVEMLARELTKKGRKTAVLSRGYGRDEPYALAQNLPHTPVITGWDRAQNGKKAVKEYAVDTLILDDAFQHWRVARDMDIVALDSTNPFGNMNVLPRGILREPLSGLRRADIFVLTKCGEGKKGLSELRGRLTAINPRALIAESVHLPVCLYELHSASGGSIASIPFAKIENQKVCLVCGIAEPLSFENCITGLGAEVGLRFYYPDHYHYKKKDIEKIFQSCSEHNIKTIVTTEKDAVKLKKYPPPATHYPSPILVLRIELKITKGEEEFFGRLASLYSS